MTAKVTGEKPVGPRLSSTAVAEDVVTVNFTEDGFTAWGNVWYRGQTVSVERGTPDWEMTLNEEGRSWMEYDEDEQIDRYGRRMFRPGKWKGRSYDLTEDHLTPEDKALLASVSTDPVVIGEPPKRTPRGRGSRRRAAPTPPPLA